MVPRFGYAARTIAILTALLMVFAACTSSVPGPSTQTGAPVAGRTSLKIVAAEPTAGLDPAVAVANASIRLEELIYDTLFDRDKDFKVVPNLAENAEPSADGKSYTIRLRAAKFSDGSAITA